MPDLQMKITKLFKTKRPYKYFYWEPNGPIVWFAIITYYLVYVLLLGAATLVVWGIS